MGVRLIDYYRSKLSKENKYAFISSIIIGLLIHLYKFTNYLPNHDSLFSMYSDQNIVGSGRWALSVACGISSFYDLPWIIGILSLVFIGLTVICIVELFKINNIVLIIMISGLLVSAPATTETFFFLFTADGYMLAMLLAAVAVYCSKIGERRNTRIMVSIVCICVSCGIYQAYVSFALILSLVHLIYELLKNEYKWEDFLLWIRNQVVIYVLALTAYYVIWKLCLYFQNVPINDYQGIADVGKVSLRMLYQGLIKSIITPIFYFFQWNFIERGMTVYIFLNILFIFLFVIVFTIAIKKSNLLVRKKKRVLLLLLLSLLALLPFSCIWHFTSETIGYRPMMLQCLTLLFVLMALLCDRWCKTKLKNLVTILLMAIIFNNSLMANISYYYLDLCYERSYAESLILATQINDMRSQYEIDSVAIIGSRRHDVRLETVDSITGKKNSRSGIHVLSEVIEETLMFDQTHVMLILDNIIGMELNTVDQVTYEYLEQSDDVKELEIWPSTNCMKVINNILVIRLSEDVGK